MKLSLYLPTKTNIVNQGFGLNPTYYAKFLDSLGNPLKGHNGIDFNASHGTPLYAVCDGLAIYSKDEHDGDGIVIRTSQSYDFNAQQVYFNVINWHLCSKDDPIYRPLIPCDGNWHSVKAGELIGFTDNTGAPYESSGDHLHFGLCPVNAQWTALLPGNGFGGCIDAQPYFNTIFAGDVETISSAISTTSDVVNEIASSDATPQQKSDWLQTIKDMWASIKGRLRI